MSIQYLKKNRFGSVWHDIDTHEETLLDQVELILTELFPQGVYIDKNNGVVMPLNYWQWIPIEKIVDMWISKKKRLATHLPHKKSDSQQRED